MNDLKEKGSVICNTSEIYYVTKKKQSKDIIKFLGKSVMLAIVLFLCIGFVNAEWFDTNWHYALNISVNATNYDRIEIPVEVGINFTNLLENKSSGTFDENSVRVIETTSFGTLEERESSFYKYQNFNTSTNAVGLVVFIMNGTTKNNTVRNFTVYFDIIENGAKSAVYYNFSNGKGLWGEYSNTTKRFDEVINLTYNLAPFSSLSITWKGWINTSGGNFNFSVENILGGISCGELSSKSAILTIDNDNVISSLDICNKNISNTKVLDKKLHNVTLFVFTLNSNPKISANVTIRLKWNASGTTEVIPKINLYGDAWTYPVNVSKGNLTSLYSGIINTPGKFSYYNRGENLSMSVNITYANTTTKNITCAFLDSLNNTKFINNLINSSSSLLGEWYSAVNYSLNSSDATGMWKIFCNATDENNYKASFSNYFYVKSYKPALNNVGYKDPAGWSKVNISLNASDSDDENITIKLYILLNGSSWTLYEEKTGNSHLEFIIRNFSCWDIEKNVSFFFVYNDSDNVLNSSTYNFSITKANVSVNILLLLPEIINRTRNYSTVLNFYDVENQSVVSNAKGFLIIRNASNYSDFRVYNCTSSNGNCTITFNVNTSWNAGKYDYFGSINEGCYSDKNTSISNMAVFGRYNISNISIIPNGSILYKNNSYNFNLTIRDEDNNIVHPGVNWNDSYGFLNNSENFGWQIPLNYTLGADIINISIVPQDYYYNYSQTLSVTIYSLSKVEILSPLTNISYNGIPIEFKCKVSDLNGSGIQNYPILFFVNGVIKGGTGLVTLGDGTESVIYSPHQPGNYTFKCEILDENNYYKANISTSNSTIKISGNITIENLTTDKFFVDMNYGILNLNASIKGVFVSNVWAKFEGDGESIIKDLNNIFGNCTGNFETCIYATTFTPAKKDFYNITIFVNDTANNTVSSTYTNKFYSSSNSAAILIPESIDKTIILGESFSVNITLNNTGNATMLDFNLTIQIPYGFSNHDNYLGNLSINSSQKFIFNITSNESIYDIINILNFTVSWKNPDNSLNTTKTNITVSVSLPPTLRMNNHYLNYTIIDGTAINGNFTILSIGNESVEGIVCSIKDGNICNSWLSYSPLNTFLEIQPNNNETVNFTISVPKGTYAGEYISNIVCNATFSNCARPERCVDQLLLNITIPINSTWEVQPSFNFTVAAGTSSNLSIMVTNNGNIDTQFVYLIVNKSLTNASVSLSSNDIYVAKGTTGNIPMEFSFTGIGISNLNLTIKNIYTREIRNISIKINATNFPPIIENATVSPSSLYYGNVTISANVRSSSICQIDKVWANITKPNSSKEILFVSNMSNIYRSIYTPGQSGTYRLKIYANDSCGAINNSEEISFLYFANISERLFEINKTLANYSSILSDMSQNLSNLSANYFSFLSLMDEMRNEIRMYNETLNNLTNTLSNYSAHINMIDEINKTLSDYVSTLNYINSSVSNYSFYSQMLVIMNNTLTNYSTILANINTSISNYSYYSSLLTQINSTLESYNLILSQMRANMSDIPLIKDYISGINSTLGEMSSKLTDKSWNIEPDNINVNAFVTDYGYLNLTVHNTGMFAFDFDVDLYGNATLFSNASGSIFVPIKASRNLQIFYSMTNISAGNYLLNVSLSNANATPAYRYAYINFNISAYIPKIKKINISRDIVRAVSGSNITVSAIIADASAVDNVWMQMHGENYTLSLSANSWNIVLNTSNFTVGDHEFTIFVKDIYGSIENKTSWFEIYTQTIFFGGENNVLTEFKFYRAGNEGKEEDLITNFSNKEGKYNETITPRNYDIVLNVRGNVIKILNVSLTHSFYDAIKIDEIYRGNVSIPGTTTTLNVFFINVSDDFKNVLKKAAITLNYSGKYNYDMEKQVKIYHCNIFDDINQKCVQAWEMLNSTVNMDEHTVTAEVTGFSAYAAARAIICGDGFCEGLYGEKCGTCSADCGTCPPVPVSSGGTTSGGSVALEVSQIYQELQTLKESVKNISPKILESVSNYTNITQALIPSVKIEPEGVDIALKAGESKNYSIRLFNDMSEDLITQVSVSGDIKELIKVEDKIVMASKSYSTLNFMIFSSVDMSEKDYYGKIEITSLSFSRSIPVHIIISANNPVLEPKISVATEEVQQDGDIRFNVLLKNIGYKKKFNVDLVYRIKDANNKILKEFKDSIEMEDLASYDKNFSVKNLNLSAGQYIIEIEAGYLNKTVSAIGIFKVYVSHFTYLLAVIMVLFLVLAGFLVYKFRKYLKARELAKLKYAVPIDVKKLPVGDIWLGNIAENNIKAVFDRDDLTTHLIVAGATGSGKTVAAMGIVESILEKDIPVVVFDPTAQWTGFLRPNKDEKMFKYYSKFGLKREDARSFKGVIYEVTNSDIHIDLRKYMNPGEISVFTLNKVPIEEYGKSVENIIKSVFEIPWEESSSLKMVVVFDEVHRLIKKAGEEGGYLSLEKACREFRKWGIGLIMVSQVLSDFKEQIKGNIMTEVQLHTKSLADIGRVAEKYGADYSKSVTLMEVGTGMMQNPKFNNGKPWFIDFKPLVSSPHKLVESDILQYNKFNISLEEMEHEIQDLKSKNINVIDLEIELKLAKDKLKEAKFRMVEIYIDSLRNFIKKKQK
ncbi:MAG: DUF87 domain-containing protein [Candidatus Altarchaeum sp.]|nr:DUF87 domain-containing protein [Candidatus Altarchaeum sp.]